MTIYPSSLEFHIDTRPKLFGSELDDLLESVGKTSSYVFELLEQDGDKKVRDHGRGDRRCVITVEEFIRMCLVLPSADGSRHDEKQEEDGGYYTARAL